MKYAQFPFVRLDEKDHAATVPSLRSNWARFGTAGYPGTFGTADKAHRLRLLLEAAPRGG